MELNSTSIKVSCLTFCGDASNLSDPSETLLIVRLPHLTPRKERELQEAVTPVIIAMIKQFEQATKDINEDKS